MKDFLNKNEPLGIYDLCYSLYGKKCQIKNFFTLPAYFYGDYSHQNLIELQFLISFSIVSLTHHYYLLI